MGQKVHPIGFRLGITEEHKSKWYANFSDYKNYLKTDFEIRKVWSNLLKELGKNQLDEISDRSNLVINYPPTRDQIHLNIYTVNPDLLISELKTLSSQVRFSKFLGNQLENRKLIVILRKVKFPSIEPNFVAQSVAKKLEKRMPFRRAVRTALSEFKKGAKQSKLDPRQKGIKIQVGGRLNGAEIARAEWVREGRIPLHTLQAKIQYATERAETIYGTLGVKVWICKG
uniref:Small ribosomal subunit protein uS3c n=1 Tax=Pseudellipsoidion edaphicum TaxID=1431838 RepID=A0A3R5U0Y2_9STRA|nr:ribosomal protein S3 [Pseudellipsoidion edaphicum]QAA11956.1 ribosomal protein S3 [Pseudellipsoidion edaphicum]